MRKFLFASGMIIGGLTMSVASAQDCCPVQYDTCCEAGFDGFYVGGNVGALSHTAHRNDFDGFLGIPGFPTSFSTISTDVTAGVQLGYDWQCSNAVFGLVVDWNWANSRHRLRSRPAFLGTLNEDVRSEFDWFTTIRGRAGLTVCDALVYVTGGAAVTRVETRWNSDLVLLGSSFRQRDNRWGWTGGVGAEFILGCNWSLGAEFLFMQFDNRNRTFTSPVASPATFTVGQSDSAWVGRVLLNYRFGDLFCCW